jgi:hypoxanthine-DNA glycosylase
VNGEASAAVRVEGFPPISSPRMHTLVLGSLPSRKSLELGQYYGHPQNAFWRIMGALIGAGRELPYADRVRMVAAANIGVWDVLRSSVRPGSMDADIDVRTAVANDFDRFLLVHPTVRRVCFNGRKAAELFERNVRLSDEPRRASLEFIRLPSTSPAYASMSFDEKLRAWSVIVEPPSTSVWRRRRFCSTLSHE